MTEENEGYDPYNHAGRYLYHRLILVAGSLFYVDARYFE